MYHQTAALVISATDYLESDIQVTYLSRENGKKRAVARGVKKAKSSLRAPLQPFCHSLLYVYHGKGHDLITQARLKDFFPGIRDSVDSSLWGLYVMELVERGLPWEEPAPPVFDLALEVLTMLDRQGQDDMLLRYFEARLLSILGFKPVTTHCVRCGGSDVAAFSPHWGGALCPPCALGAGSHRIIPVTGETLGVLGALYNVKTAAVPRIRASANAKQQLSEILEDFWNYHMGEPSRLRRLIRNGRKAQDIDD